MAKGYFGLSLLGANECVRLKKTNSGLVFFNNLVISASFHKSPESGSGGKPKSYFLKCSMIKVASSVPIRS